MTVGIPFGNYRLVRRLARGGMAEVFLATQSGPEGFERTVAVKRILPHLADSPQFVEMFMDEARLAAQLSHPNIAHIYEFGRVEDSYFIAMEYIDGIDLSAVVLDGMKQPLPLEHAARVIADVCAALHYAHSLTGKDGRPVNLVHRDISPQNILVSFAGAVKVVDFGIAKAAIHIERTRPGVVRGKYTYMSPEQVEGKPLDGRTDLFCAGIVLWELCTAVALFPRNDPIQAMRRIRACEIPKPTRAGAALPPKLEEILMRALARRREDRYRNAAEMQMDLEEYLRSASQICNSIVLGEYFTKHYRRLRPTPEQVRSAAQVRDRTAGVGRGTAGVVKGTAPVAAPRAPAASPEEEETLIVEDPSGRGEPQAEPLTILRPPPMASPGAQSGKLQAASTLKGPPPVVQHDPSYMPPVPLEETPSEPKTLAYSGRHPVPGLAKVGAAVGGEITIASEPGLQVRQATPPGVTIDPAIASVSTIVDSPADEPTKMLASPERVRSASLPSPPLVSKTMPLRSLGQRALVVGLVSAVGVAGILTGHWLSSPGVSSGSAQADLQRLADAGPPPDQRAALPLAPDAAVVSSRATLRVLSQPEGASVTIDGSDVRGSTPLVQALPAGTHTVAASYPGFEDRAQQVSLEPGQELTVKLTLRRLPSEQVVSLKRHGAQKKRIKRPPLKQSKTPKKVVSAQPRDNAQGLLSISTIPWSTVYLGNRKIGITPFANVSIPAGTHLLRFVDEQGRSYTKKVTVPPERVTKLRFRLPDA